MAGRCSATSCGRPCEYLRKWRHCAHSPRQVGANDNPQCALTRWNGVCCLVPPMGSKHSMVLMVLVLCAGGTLLSGCWSSITPGDASLDSGAVEPGLEARIPDAGPPVDSEVAEDPLTLEEFLAERRQLRCIHRVQCDIRDQRQEACHPDFRDDIALEFHVEAVRTGTMTFDEVAARSCLDAVAGAIPSCDSQTLHYLDALFLPDADRTGIEVPCNAVFRGAVGDGVGCRLDECEDGLVCMPTAGTSSADRYCRGPARSEAGGPCATPFDCGARAEDAHDYACDRGACRRLSSLGEPCDELDAHSCAGGLTCLTDVCVERLEEGESCHHEWNCLTPLRCVDSLCGIGRAEGEPCDHNSECSPGSECRGEPGPKTCQTNDGNEVGDLCYATDRLLGSTCRDDLRCSLDSWDTSTLIVIGSGVCEAGLATGGACDADISCARGTVCAAGRCTRAVVPGGACELHDECPLFHHCDGGLCRPLPRPGEACREDSGCIKGRCQGGMCCLLPDGAACATDFVGRGLGECNSYCMDRGYCHAPSVSCDGCGGCWPDYDTCVPTCAAS